MKIVGYDLGGKIFSLIEIEHCILRGALSKPQIFGSSFSIPKFGKKDSKRKIALAKPEPRINFILNCGTYSSPYFVWVFNGGNRLEEELDHAAVHFIRDQVYVSSEKKTYKLFFTFHFFSLSSL